MALPEATAPASSKGRQKPRATNKQQGQRQRRTGRGSAATAGAAASLGGKQLAPAGDEDDWELQLALQLSMCSDDAAAERQVAAAVAASKAAAAAAEGGPEAAAEAPMGTTQGTGDGPCSSTKATSAAAGSKTTGDAAAGSTKGSQVGRRRHKKLSALEKQMVQLTADDIFDLYVAFEPGDRGIISRRNLVRQMNQLGVAVPDDDMLQDMVQLGQRAALSTDGAMKGGVSLEQFTALVRQLWPEELLQGQAR